MRSLGLKAGKQASQTLMHKGGGNGKKFGMKAKHGTSASSYSTPKQPPTIQKTSGNPVAKRMKLKHNSRAAGPLM